MSVQLTTFGRMMAPGARPDRGQPLGTGQPIRVGRLASETGKTVRAIHLYEELGLLVPIERSKGGYRLYGPDALVRVRWISKLQDMGFSLSEIQDVLHDWEGSHSAPSAMTRVRALYEQKLRETKAQLGRLRALEHELVASLAYLQTCESTCDPVRLLHVCTCCDLHAERAPELVAGFHATSLVAMSPAACCATVTRAPENGVT